MQMIQGSDVWALRQNSQDFFTWARCLHLGVKIWAVVYFPQSVLDYQISKLHRKHICRNRFLRIRWTASFLSSPRLCIFHPFLSHSFISFWPMSKLFLLFLLLSDLLFCRADPTSICCFPSLSAHSNGSLQHIMDVKCRASGVHSFPLRSEGVGSTLSSGEIKVHYLAWLPCCPGWLFL